MNDVCTALRARRLKIQGQSCTTFVKAAEYRQMYNLTYFDSLHAASAFQYDKGIVSTDDAYDKIGELKRRDPYKYKCSV